MSNVQNSVELLSGTDVSFSGEARLVQRRAQDREMSIIRLGPIVFFSTVTGDAWMLDANDGEAACLARDGELEPVPIHETANRFGIEWHARYQIEEGMFVVMEANGTTRAVAGYPVLEIQQIIDEHPLEESLIGLDAGPVQARLKETGRNDPCPCGSGRKYKKCCLTSDEASARQIAANPIQRSLRRAELSLEPEPEDAADELTEIGDDDDIIEIEGDTPLTFADAGPTSDAAALCPEENEDEAELSPEVEAAADLIWEEFEAISHPSTGQMDAHLERLLALPPEATSWNEVFLEFVRHRHTNLPGVFRRISAAVPATKASGLSFFYWSAIETFVVRQRADLVPEIVAQFCRLDRTSYDPDALHHILEWVLAAGYELEALQLEEHFLPVMRGDELMPHAVTDACRHIFELRVGMRLRKVGASNADIATVACELNSDLENEIRADYVQRAALVICNGMSAEPVTRRDFEFMTEKGKKGEPDREAALRQFEVMMGVAREAWEFEGRPPGCALRGLWLLVDSVFEERNDGPRNRKAGMNLLDCLHPNGMERRVARSSRDMLGTNAPLAHLLLEAHTDLRRFAVRHGLIDQSLAAKSEKNVALLKEKLGFVA
ncbi:MAG: SEC-C metal-binding domain-containing protein [Opitutaceae bacterium]